MEAVFFTRFGGINIVIFYCVGDTFPHGKNTFPADGADFKQMGADELPN